MSNEHKKYDKQVPLIPTNTGGVTLQIVEQFNGSGSPAGYAVGLFSVLSGGQNGMLFSSTIVNNAQLCQLKDNLYTLYEKLKDIPPLPIEDNRPKESGWYWMRVPTVWPWQCVQVTLSTAEYSEVWLPGESKPRELKNAYFDNAEWRKLEQPKE